MAVVADTEVDGEAESWVAYSAFSARGPEPGSPVAGPDELAAEVAEGLGAVTIRGIYDLTGFRAEADLLLWLVAPDPVELQAALTSFRRSRLGAMVDPWWSAIGVHRPAEFNARHLPAFVEGREPLDFVCVYPYVRTHEWYLLPAAERSELLAEHGRMGRRFGEVHANTVSAFGLGDYEWLLAFESDRLGSITDLMRHLRGAGARRFTRHELPFLTGRRRSVTEIATLISSANRAHRPVPLPAP